MAAIAERYGWFLNSRHMQFSEAFPQCSVYMMGL